MYISPVNEYSTLLWCLRKSNETTGNSGMVECIRDLLHIGTHCRLLYSSVKTFPSGLLVRSCSVEVQYAQHLENVHESCKTECRLLEGAKLVGIKRNITFNSRGSANGETVGRMCGLIRSIRLNTRFCDSLYDLKNDSNVTSNGSATLRILRRIKISFRF